MLVFVASFLQQKARIHADGLVRDKSCRVEAQEYWLREPQYRISHTSTLRRLRSTSVLSVSRTYHKLASLFPLLRPSQSPAHSCCYSPPCSSSSSPSLAPPHSPAHTCAVHTQLLPTNPNCKLPKFFTPEQNPQHRRPPFKPCIFCSSSSISSSLPGEIQAHPCECVCVCVSLWVLLV